eukprot:6172551-Pleurochrysis_carterae.AAC.2
MEEIQQYLRSKVRPTLTSPHSSITLQSHFSYSSLTLPDCQDFLLLRTHENWQQLLLTELCAATEL